MTTNSGTLLLVKSSGLGESEIDLGEKLIVSFFAVLIDSETIPSRIGFLKTGIFLTTEGSQVVESLRRLEERGVEILSCKTCLDYYGRADKLVVGKPTDMKQTVDALMSYDKVVTL